MSKEIIKASLTIVKAQKMKIVKKIKANTKEGWKGFVQQIFKVSIYSKRLLQDKYLCL